MVKNFFSHQPVTMCLQLIFTRYPRHVRMSTECCVSVETDKMNVVTGPEV